MMDSSRGNRTVQELSMSRERMMDRSRENGQRLRRCTEGGMELRKAELKKGRVTEEGIVDRSRSTE